MIVRQLLVCFLGHQPDLVAKHLARRRNCHIVKVLELPDGYARIIVRSCRLSVWMLDEFLHTGGEELSLIFILIGSVWNTD